MKYRKKALIVEAEQFLGKTVPGVFWMGIDDARVTTIHGDTLRVQAGDWIIQEQDGEHYYPCKDEVFKATYVPADAGIHLRVYSGFGWADYDQTGTMLERGDVDNPRVSILQWLNSGVEIVASVRHDQDIDFYYRRIA